MQSTQVTADIGDFSPQIVNITWSCHIKLGAKLISQLYSVF